MIGMVKLFAFFLIAVICLVKCIDASCMKYGHSCWGAHGKRNIIPLKEVNDRWKVFRFSKRNSLDPYNNKLVKTNSLPQRLQFSDNDGSLNQEFRLPQFSFYDDTVESFLRNSVGDSGENIQQIKVFPSNKRMNSQSPAEINLI